MPEKLNVLFLAAEAVPFVKIGGLADVAGSLPLALRSLPSRTRQGVKLDVRLVLPMHSSIQFGSNPIHKVMEFPLTRQGGNLPVQVFETDLDGMPVYFINGEPVSKAVSVYSLDPAQDREKYGFFSMAGLELARRMDWKPDIIHANDWHSSLAIYALRSRGKDARLRRMRSVLTLHNLPYNGGYAPDVLEAYGLQPLHAKLLPPWAPTQPLPLGLWAADVIVPVSPTYAREILTPAFGCDMDPFLRSRADSITGILNGLDLEAWDPETDKCLAANFNKKDLSSRAANKAALQRHLGLEQESDIPFLAMIGRINWQKGVDIALEVLRKSTALPWQFVLLGSSEPDLENAARNLQAENPGRVRVIIGYDAPLSRLIYGGVDMLLMPSRYEPCGLAQMTAMRYGCVPVVHATGGLKDTVQEGKTGFLFETADPGSMLEALQRAFTVFAIPEQWVLLQKRGMQEDFSWQRFAAQYAGIYLSLKQSRSNLISST
jgi:starch synthase